MLPSAINIVNTDYHGFWLLRHHKHRYSQCFCFDRPKSQSTTYLTIFGHYKHKNKALSSDGQDDKRASGRHSRQQQQQQPFGQHLPAKSYNKLCISHYRFKNHDASACSFICHHSLSSFVFICSLPTLLTYSLPSSLGGHTVACRLVGYSHSCFDGCPGNSSVLVAALVPLSLVSPGCDWVKPPFWLAVPIRCDAPGCPAFKFSPSPFGIGRSEPWLQWLAPGA